MADDQAKNDENTLPSYLNPGDESFDLFSSPMYLMANADARFHEDLDRVIGKLGFSRTHYRILTVLDHCNPMTVGDLATGALLKRSTCSRSLVSMREKGWVLTEANASDSRLIDVYMTPDGKALLKKAMKSSANQTRRAMKSLSEEDMGELTRILKTIVANLSQLSIE